MLSPAASLALAANPTQSPDGPQLAAGGKLEVASKGKRSVFGAPMMPARTPGIGDGIAERAAGFNAEEEASRTTPLDLQALQPAVDVSKTKVRGPAFNEPGGLGEKIEMLAASLMSAGGNPMGAQAIYQRMGERQRQRYDTQQRQDLWSRQDTQRAEDRRWQVEDRDAHLNAPQYFMSGRDRVSFNPVTGESSVVYDGPEDYQAYADTLGLEPGQDGYNTAVQDYVLRSAGPTAVAGKQSLEGVRQSNRVALRGMPTYRDTHPRPSSGSGGQSPSRAPTMAGTMAPILGKVARGEPLTPGEQQAWAMYRSGRTRPSAGGGAATPASGGPPVGTVRGGYRFKGGDPASKANWERAR